MLKSMRALPEEFDPNHVAAKATNTPHMYAQELATKDPMRSVLAANPEIYFVPPKRLRMGPMGKPGSYYDTTTGAKHPYWQDKDLPVATRSLERLRSDMLTWGYCKIDSTEPRSGRGDSPARFGPS